MKTGFKYFIFDCSTICFLFLQPKKMEQKRIVFLDYLRAAACFLVVMVHANETFYGTDGILVRSEEQRLWMAIWDGVSRISVPLFIITSSYLLVPMKENMGWGEFFKRRFLRIIPPMIVFMVIYSLFPAITGTQSWEQALDTLYHIPLNFPENAFQLWFMYPLIGLYLLIPILSPWLRTATARQEQFFIALWLITTCLPFVNQYYGDVLGQCWWNQYYMLYDFSGYPGYLVLGHYIKRHLNWSKPQRLMIGSLALLAGWAFTVLYFYQAVIPGTHQELEVIEFAWSFCIINCVVATFGAFLLFTTIECPGMLFGLVQNISLNSYGLYLMHLLWLTLWAPLLQPALPVGIAIPAIAIATWVSSYLTTWLISFLPGKRWIVG